MMESISPWRGREMEVDVLYSYAGIATQIVVRSRGETLLFDCGDGAFRSLIERDLKEFKSLSAVVFSHGHYDHVGGLWSLLGGLRCAGRNQALPILAPKDCTELEIILDGFERAYPDSLPFSIARITPLSGEATKVGAFRLTPFEVWHAGSIADGTPLPRIPAFGWSVQVGKERFVYSGDTTETPSLEAAVIGADFAVIEATLETGKSDVHLSRDYAERIGKTARDYLLIHGIHPVFG